MTFFCRPYRLWKCDFITLKASHELKERIGAIIIVSQYDWSNVALRRRQVPHDLSQVSERDEVCEIEPGYKKSLGMTRWGW